MEDYKKTLQNITSDALEREFMDTPKQQVNSGFDAKNYLNTKLEKNQTEKVIQIRLLPIDATSNTPFFHIKTHRVKVSKEVSPSEWKNYFCLSKTNPIDHEKFGCQCPFCQLQNKAYEQSLAETDPVKKKRYKDISLQNRKNDSCIVRCIERGAEADGPKFYKFNVRKDGFDLYNKVKSLYTTRKQESINDGDEPENILDIYKGKDLKLTIKLVQDGKTSIDVIDCGKNKPLSKDPEEMERWINDPKKWSDVFAVKPTEYLKVIMDGKVPFFDKMQGKWVERLDPNELIKKKEEQMNESIQNAMSGCVPQQQQRPVNMQYVPQYPQQPQTVYPEQQQQAVQDNVDNLGDRYSQF